MAENESTRNTGPAYTVADYQANKLELEVAERMREHGIENAGGFEAPDDDTFEKAQHEFDQRSAPPGADAIDAQMEADSELAAEWAVGAKEIVVPADRALLTKVVDYFLRKWAAFEMYNADVEEGQASTAAPNVYPIRFPGGRRAGKAGEEGEDEGGETGWFMMEGEDSLKTGRINLNGDYAGLGPFREALAQMVECANKKGWQNIGFLGFSPDMAWVAVQEHNIKHQDKMMDVTNYMPADQALDRYRDLLRVVAERTLQAQAGGGR